MIKIDELKGIPQVGKQYLVPCYIYKFVEEKSLDQISWMDIEPNNMEYPIPIINHPHSDEENGQHQEHYHVDFRFFNKRKFLLRDDAMAQIINIPLRLNATFNPIYKPLICIRSHQLHITHPKHVKNSKIGCMKKYKCSHKGYNLANEPIINGCIQCPLHGLKFNIKTGEIINMEEVMEEIDV